ncbi:unnamed protein product [Urochloa decumbens]|uniref:F-box domain-containing protein n=1 Tax=Urochloa decumbens TaxID=240449 RepID=A0ABC9AJY1_9POAL
MPPERRPRGAHRSAPYGRGWLPPSCFRSDYDGNGSDDGGEVFPVPDDAISAVLARLVSAADVVRSAATCRRWACLVAKDAAVLSGALPPLPCLTPGFLHQENAGATARRRRRLSSETAPQPCFVPTAAAARLIGQQDPSHTTIADAVLGLDLDDDNRRGLFEHARPMAARNGWLVLELRQERYTDGVKLCVCNPMRGELFMLPPLAGTDNLGDYACALYTGHDFEPPRPLSAFFRLLIVYNRRAFTALRSYSSDTSCWSTEAKRSWGPKIPSEKLHELGQSIVVGGVAYWHMRCTAFAVRVDTPEPTEVCMPPSGPCIRDLPLGSRREAYIHRRCSCRDDGCSGEWEERGRCIRLKQLKVRYEGIGEEKVPPFGDKMNLRWFCEKSGNLLFTLGQGTGSPGAYVLNMATERVEKVADGIDCDSWRNLVGYEMDGAAYLASIYRRRCGS